MRCAAKPRAIEEVLALEAQPEEVTKFAEAFSPGITARAVAERLAAASKGTGNRKQGTED